MNTRFLNFEQRFEIWGVDFYKYCLIHWKRTQAALPLAARETPPLHPAGGGVDLRITVLARNIPHRNYAVARTGIIPLVFLCHLFDAFAPCVMELSSVGVDDIVI